MGKGLVTINPYYSDKFLINKVGMGGLVLFLHSCLDIQNTLLSKYHYLYYYLTLSIQPRMVFLVDENL